MNIRIYIFSILICAAVSAAQDEPKKPLTFGEGTRKGITLSRAGHLSLYSFHDDFSKDTRTSYSTRLKRNSKMDEWGYIPLQDRSGVYYSEKSKALLMEAGQGDTVSLAKRIQPVTDFFLEISFTPRAVYAPNGTVYIVCYAGNARMITAVIPGKATARASVITGGKGARVYTAKEQTGYSGNLYYVV